MQLNLVKYLSCTIEYLNLKNILILSKMLISIFLSILWVDINYSCTCTVMYVVTGTNSGDFVNKLISKNYIHKK